MSYNDGMNQREKISVLHVDDDPDLGDLTAEYLESEDERISVQTATNADEGLEYLFESEFDCIVSDYDMPGQNGIEFLETVREVNSDLPFILCTGKGSEEVASEAISSGVSDYLQKEGGTEQYELLAKRIVTAVDKYRTEQELDSLRRQYTKLVEQSFVGVYIIQNGEFVYANPRLAEIHGYDDPGKVIGMSPLELVAPDERDRVQANLERRLTGEEEDIQYQTTGLRKDGDRIDIQLHGSRIRFEGEPAVIGAELDVTERQKREQQLQESNEAYESLFHGVNDAVFVADLDGKIVAVNETATDRLGYSEEEFLEKHIANLDAAEYEERIDSRIDTLQNEGSLTFETEHVAKSGDRIPVEIESTSVEYFGEDAILSVARDITERKRRERERERLTDELERRVEFFEQAQELADLGAWETDLRNGEGWWTEQINQIYGLPAGYEPEPGEGIKYFHSEDQQIIREAFEQIKEGGEPYDLELRVLTDGEETKWVRTRGKPKFEDGEVVQVRGTIQNITARKEREKALEKRERIHRELHATTKDFLEADTESKVFDGIVEAISSALDFTHFGVMEFDQDKGRLETQAVSSELNAAYSEFPTLEPSDNPLWKVFQDGESRMFNEIDPHWLPDDIVEQMSNLMAVSIGDYGLIYTVTTETDSIEDHDVELIELLAANAETIMSRMSRESQLADISQELSLQESRVEDLEGLIGSIETIQHRLAGSDTKESLQKAVCEELVKTDRVGFAWMGQPEIGDTQLLPAARAGSDRGFLDAVTLEGGEEDLPSQRAVATRQTVNISNISTHVPGMSWAKDAISRGFRSTLSIPLLHDDVLYGVLTLYSSEQEAFEPLYQDIFEEVASLFTQYLSIVNIQFAERSGNALEIEFSLSDSNYPLHLLAERTGSTIEFETVLESSEETVGVLVTVRDGEPENVVEAAKEMSLVAEATPFGELENNQISLRVRRPFLATEVTPHGGRLTSSVASPAGTTVSINLPERVSVRPLAESLTTRYQNIELVARRETTGRNVGGTVRMEEALTERQLEILKAAYHGGYYETPREVSGEHLAESFGISNSVVHGHLQAAHKRILERILVSDSDKEGRNS